MNYPQSFANIDAAFDIASHAYPQAKIVMVEHSHDNIVAMIDEEYALRFPRDKNAYIRSLYEVRILNRLKTVQTLKIPRVLGENKNPSYLITSYVPGHHLRPSDIQSLSEKNQQDFAKEIALFSYTMHRTFILEEEQSVRKNLQLDALKDNEPWLVYYEKVVQNGSFSTQIQKKLAKNTYCRWVEICNKKPTVIVHDDLHSENMKFDDKNKLIGILDFGDTTAGTPEQELRQLYRVNENVMLAAVREYQQLSGLELDVEAIKLWATMKELADYSKAITAINTNHHSSKRASQNLNKWMPKGEWGQGYNLLNIENCQ